jgi:hypothetical protein
MLLRFNYVPGKVLKYIGRSVTFRRIQKGADLVDNSKIVYFSEVLLKTIAKDEEGFHVKLQISDRKPYEDEDIKEDNEDIKVIILPVNKQVIYMVIDEFGNIKESAGSQEVSTLVFPSYEINVGEVWVSNINFELPNYNKKMDIPVNYKLKNINNGIAYIEGSSLENTISLPMELDGIDGKKQILQGNFIVSIDSYFEFDTLLGTNILQNVNIETVIKVEDYVMENNITNFVKFV